MVKWGTLLWPAFVIISNALLSLLLKRLGKNPMKYQAEIALEHFFSCNEAIIINQQLEVQKQPGEPNYTADDDSQDEHPIEKSVVFVNTNTSNEHYNMNDRIVHFLFAGYYNTFVTYFGYFCIQTFFLYEKLSPVCLDEFVCEPVRKDTNCSTSFNVTNGDNFLCSQYRMDTLESILVNLAVTRTVFSLLVEINMAIFKLVRFVLTRSRCKSIHCCLSDFWLMLIMVVSLVLIFLFWVVIPFTILQVSSFLLTRSATSKIVSIVATSLVVVFTALMINLINNDRKNNYLLYMEI
jgi:hypothetical protein